MFARKLRVAAVAATVTMIATALPAQAGKAVPSIVMEPALCKTTATNTVACQWRVSISGIRSGAISSVVARLAYSNSGNTTCPVVLQNSTRTASLYLVTFCEATRPESDTGTSVWNDFRVLGSKSQVLVSASDSRGWRSEKCPTGFAYQPVTDSAMWNNALSSAVSRGGRLAVVDTADKQACLEAFIPAGEYWLGGNDSGTEGSWAWLSATSYFCLGNNPCEAQGGAFTNWASGEPNNSQPNVYSNDEDCVGFISNYTWNDWDCDRSKAFIVEIPAP